MNEKRVGHNALESQSETAEGVMNELELALDVAHYGAMFFTRKVESETSPSQKRTSEKQADKFRRAKAVLHKIDTLLVNGDLVLKGKDALYGHLLTLQQKAEQAGKIVEAETIGCAIDLLVEGEQELQRKREHFVRQMHVVPKPATNHSASQKSDSGKDTESAVEEERESVMEELLSLKTRVLYTSLPTALSKQGNSGYQTVSEERNPHFDWVAQHNISALTDTMKSLRTPEGFGIEAFTRHTVGVPAKKSLFGMTVQDAVPPKDEAVPVSEFAYMEDRFNNSSEPAYVLQYRFDTGGDSNVDDIQYVDYSEREGNVLHVTILLSKSVAQKIAHFLQRIPENNVREFMRELARRQAKDALSTVDGVEFDQLWKVGSSATHNRPISPPYRDVDAKSLPFGMYYDPSVALGTQPSGVS